MASLAHVNIRTSHLEESVAFYRDVIGLVPGTAATRPHSDDHVWMSDQEGRPCIHLQRTDATAEDGRERAGVHHIAFACSHLAAWRRKLAAHQIDFSELEFAEAGLLQFNLTDPDGVRLELLFGSEP